MRIWVVVAVGGMLGAVARYAVTRLLLRLGVVPAIFPWATLVVNLVGSFVMGYLWGRRFVHPFSEAWHAFFLIGILGGFTTFSAYALEGLLMMVEGKWGLMLLYMGGSPVLGMVLVAAGFGLGKMMG